MAGVDHKAADQIVERSLEAGVNFIDIADVYWFGESERLLGQALKNLNARARTLTRLQARTPSERDHKIDPVRHGQK